MLRFTDPEILFIVRRFQALTIAQPQDTYNIHINNIYFSC